MYVTLSREGDQNLYRLTTRALAASDRCDANGDLPLASVLAPLGVEIVCAEAGEETDGAHVPFADQCGSAAVAVINLTVPIDLPAIDHVLRGSGYQVLDLRQAGPARQATV